jgi:hypothetical protein
MKRVYTVGELSREKFNELKESYFDQLLETDDDVLEGCTEIPDDVIYTHYEGIMFTDDDFC